VGKTKNMQKTLIILRAAVAATISLAIQTPPLPER
jgi:hypothetical protein